MPKIKPLIDQDLRPSITSQPNPKMIAKFSFASPPRFASAVLILRENEIGPSNDWDVSGHWDRYIEDQIALARSRNS